MGAGAGAGAVVVVGVVKIFRDFVDTTELICLVDESRGVLVLVLCGGN